ncbi:Alpha/Beta hydrolase protein [Rhodotorula diobovata]|uniref:Alpha/Beta hydrolase protein n=1 Tax=Rhodotorula diobovata TaxID=5288 RepID=A0A5C5G5K5_9BASI|nr:Alpha/Beta hydrolase protein [Rhodotorula diobovata]
MSFVKRVRLVLVSSLVAYIAFLASLILEPVQTGLIYLHGLRFPHGTDFSRPELVGFAPGKVRPFNLTTPDGATLGAWHVLPRNAYEAAIERLGVPEEGPLPDEVFDEALRDPSTPTVTYNHGNAGTRAAGNRVRVARHMSDMDCNFLIIDYRGFADSSRSPPPSEEGLLIDARRAWDFLQVDKGVEAGNIAIMGQSLGTGVSAGLAARLAAEGITPRALVLVAPFSSIPTLLETYRLGNFIPLLSPLRRIPWLLDALLQLLKTRFNTKDIIDKVSCPILILHAQNDPVIPFSHSRALAEHLLGPLLAPHAHEEDKAEEAKRRLVRETKAGGWGVVSRFEREEGRGEVVWAEALKGAHNEIGTSEYSIELIKEVIYKGKASV